MRRTIAYAIIIIACFLLQCTVFKSLSIAGISPNLMIVVTAAFGFMRGKKEGLFVGFFSGLLLDVVFGNYLGIYAFLYMCIGYANGYFKRSFFPDEIKLPVALIAASDICCNLTIYFVLFFFRGRFNIGYYLWNIILPELVYTVAVSIVLYLVLLRINQKIEEAEKKSEAKFV